MNFKNKRHPIFLDYACCVTLARIGVNHPAPSAYWFKNDHMLYPADRITKFKDWDKLYIAAFTSEELNELLPAGITSTKVSKNQYTVTHAMYKIQAHAVTEGEAKVKALQQFYKQKYQGARA